MSRSTSSAALLAAALAVACVAPGATPCGDGWCPPGLTCELDRCILPGSSNCGDGVVDDSRGEECDDGAAQNTLAPNVACRPDCRFRRCGDGVRDTIPGPQGQLPEECDEGAGNSDVDADRCRASCVEPRCGDGVVDDGEQLGCLEPAFLVEDVPAAENLDVRPFDMDRDGLVDLVVSRPAEDLVTVYFGEPNGKWNTLEVPITGLEGHVVIADLDGDLDPDLVAEVRPTGTTRHIRSFFSLGDRTFTDGDLVSISPDDHLLGAADIGFDGRADVVILGRSTLIPNSGFASVLESGPDRTFLGSKLLSFSGEVSAAGLGLVSSDPLPDLVLANTASGEIQVMNGAGDASFSDGPEVAFANLGVSFDRTLVTGDFTGDFEADVVVSQLDGLVYATGLGNGSFNQPQVATVGGLVASVTAGQTHDGGNDKALEVFVSSSEGWIRRVTLDQLGTFALGPQVPYAATVGGGVAIGMSVADVDHDGFQDVVASNTSRVIAFRGGDGLLGRVSTATVGQELTAVALADFNGDQLMDAVIGGERVAMLLNDGVVRWKPDVPVEVSVDQLAAGDVDADEGRVPDVVGYRAATGELMVWHNDGSGQLGETARVVVPGGAGGGVAPLRLADLDGDERGDALVVTPAGAHVYRGRADGAVEAVIASPLTLVDEVRDAELGDADGDGELDLVLATSMGLRWFGGRGDGSFAPDGHLISDHVFDLIELGLLDGDRTLDVAGYRRSAGQLHVIHGAGTGLGSELDVVDAGPAATALLAADVNLDGHADLVLAGGFQPALFPARVDGTLAAPMPIVGGALTVSAAGTGDVSGDGRPDLVLTGGPLVTVIATRPRSK